MANVGPASPKPIRGVVGASDAEQVDTTPASIFCSIKYRICVKSDAQDKYKSMEMTVTKKGGGNFVRNVSSVLGDSLDIQANYLSLGSDGVLELVNNEVFDLEFTISKHFI